MKNTWTPEQIQYLIKNYAIVKTPKLILFLKNKTNDQIRWKAKEFKLKKAISRTKTDCSFLEDFDNPESLYWWGFLTADGCITPKQIIFSLEKKDEDYVQKFATKCASSVKYVTRINSWHKTPYTMARTVVNDKFIISRLIKKLKIKPQKTYNPFDLTQFLCRTRLIYFLGGLIDGDGHIQTKSGSSQIRIKVHFNWHKTLNIVAECLNAFYGLHFRSYISEKGWAILETSKKEDMTKLFNSLSSKTPIMPRKWNAIKYFL